MLGFPLGQQDSDETAFSSLQTANNNGNILLALNVFKSQRLGGTVMECVEKAYVIETWPVNRAMTYFLRHITQL